MYSFDFDESTCILHITTQGIWSRAKLAAYSAEALMRGTALKLRYGRFAIFIDARNFPVQTAEIARGLDFLMGKTSGLIQAPMVIVAGSTLSKLQAQRVLTGPWTTIFLDHDEATAWLHREWVERADR